MTRVVIIRLGKDRGSTFSNRIASLHPVLEVPRGSMIVPDLCLLLYSFPIARPADIGHWFGLDRVMTNLMPRFHSA
jgi:hypothetical protein